jgi:lambda family phage portal protein
VLGLDDATPISNELATLRNRSRDLNRNDAIASGATDTISTNVVGRGLRMQSQIRADQLGVAPERAREIARQAERIWSGWCKAPDAGNRLTFDEMQFVAFRKIIEDGEILALPVLGDESWRSIKRCIELIEADRLETKGLNQDPIAIGRRGEPVSYSIKTKNSKTNIITYQTIPAMDDDGRPMILHVFPTKRPGQRRGVPHFAPVLTYFKDLADYMEAEVVAARVAACLAVFVTKLDPMAGGALSMGNDTETGTNARIQSIEPGMVSYLGAGESINVVDPKRPGDSFAPFIEAVLRMIGVSLGLPYELLVKDFSKTNYSSARAALLEARRNFINWRSWFGQKFCQPIYELVMEEAFLRREFDVPSFYAYRDEYCRAAWIGGGWGWVDPVKEVEASRKAVDYGLSTLAEEAAAQGRDWEEVLEQRAREEQTEKELGVTITRSTGEYKEENTDETKDQ